MLESCGIYMVRCTTTGDYYIGGTQTSFRQRFAEHKTSLRCGRSSIPKLQAAVETYGLDAFEFIPLHACKAAEVLRKEREALATLHPRLNTDWGGESQRGVYTPWPAVLVDGTQYTLTELARSKGLSRQLLYSRYKRGLRGEALVAPQHKAPRKQYTRRK